MTASPTITPPLLIASLLPPVHNRQSRLDLGRGTRNVCTDQRQPRIFILRCKRDHAELLSSLLDQRTYWPVHLEKTEWMELHEANVVGVLLDSVCLPNCQRSPLLELARLQTGHRLPHQCYSCTAGELLLLQVIR